MFKKQETFVLNEEKKICVISNNLDNELVKSFFDVLGLVKADVEGDLEVFNTLGRLAMKKIVIVNQEKVLEKDKLSKLFDFKEEFLVLVDTFEDVQLLFEVLVDSSYRFMQFKSKDKKEAVGLSYFSSKNIEEEVNEGVVYGEAINNTKELVNKPYNYMNALDLADYALEFKRFDNVQVTVYNKTQIEAMKMGAFLGVNKGSLEEPRLIHIRYNGDPESKEIISLVGKGVMYDTGGPSTHFRSLSSAEG